MNLSNEQLKTIEQNHLGHFAYLPKNLGFDVYEMNGVTIIHCGLKTSMFNIVYGAHKDTAAGIDQIKRSYKGEPFAFYRGYTLGKHDFIQNILKKSGFNKHRFVLGV